MDECHTRCNFGHLVHAARQVRCIGGCGGGRTRHTACPQPLTLKCLRVHAGRRVRRSGGGGDGHRGRHGRHAGLRLHLGDLRAHRAEGGGRGGAAAQRVSGAGRAGRGGMGRGRRWPAMSMDALGGMPQYCRQQRRHCCCRPCGSAAAAAGGPLVRQHVRASHPGAQALLQCGCWCTSTCSARRGRGRGVTLPPPPSLQADRVGAGISQGCWRACTRPVTSPSTPPTLAQADRVGAGPWAAGGCVPQRWGEWV